MTRTGRSRVRAGPKLLTAALAVASMVGAAAAQAASPGDESVEKPTSTITEVTFQNGETTLAGSLVLPRGEPPYPAIVFLHGSGPTSRDGALAYARRYAGLGYAGLAFDKRGVGSSGGSWLSASLADLARDAVAAIDYLQNRSDIDPERIGFWGVSQAGWVATRATEFSDDVAFMVIISGGGVTPYETEMYSYRTRFEHAGLTDEEQRAALELLDKYFAFLGTGEGRKAVEAAIEENKDAPWFKHARVDRILPSSEEGRKHWSWVANWDPRSLMEKITFPTLVLFGERDTETPAALSAQRWRESLDRAGNASYTIRMFPEAGHGIRLGHHGASGERPPFAPGYHETIDGWLEEFTAGE